MKIIIPLQTCDDRASRYKVADSHVRHTFSSSKLFFWKNLNSTIFMLNMQNMLKPKAFFLTEKRSKFENKNVNVTSRCEHDDLLSFWPTDLLTYWPFCLLTFWPIDLLTYWPFDLLTFWPTDLLTYWPFDLLTFWPTDLLTLRSWPFEK
jgi:hypothetical protein